MNIKEYLKKAQNSDNIFEFQIFKSLFKETLKMEGGNKLHKIKEDSGGWTIWGIAYNKNKNVFYNFEDFKDTTKEEAEAFAFFEYYMKIRADLVPYETKLMHFDMAYNIGTNRAIKIAQKLLRLEPDGIIGKNTIAYLTALNEKDLYESRKTFYYKLAKQKENLRKFLKGWLNRTNYIFTTKY